MAVAILLAMKDSVPDVFFSDGTNTDGLKKFLQGTSTDSGTWLSHDQQQTRYAVNGISQPSNFPQVIDETAV